MTDMDIRSYIASLGLNESAAMYLMRTVSRCEKEKIEEYTLDMGRYWIRVKKGIVQGTVRK